MMPNDSEELERLSMEYHALVLLVAAYKQAINRFIIAEVAGTEEDQAEARIGLVAVMGRLK